MRHFLLLSAVLILLCRSSVSPAAAEDVSVAWRSPYGGVYSVSVNTADGSCWAGSGTCVVHVSAQGVLLSRTSGFMVPESVSVDPRDGSCWVADGWGHSQVAKLSSDGAEILRISGFGNPYSVSVNSADGSCWVADAVGNQVVHLAADGTELWRGGSLNDPRCVSVNSSDGSCWVVDTGDKQVVHLSAQGAEVFRTSIDYTGQPLSPVLAVAVNPVDGLCWVSTQPPAGFGETYELLQLAGDGTVTREALGAGKGVLAVNPADASCWAAGGPGLIHLRADFQSLSETPARVQAIAVSPRDGSVWTAEGALVHRSQLGALLGWVDVSGVPQALSDVGDGSFWAGLAGTWDAGQGKYVGALVQRIGADGSLLASSTAFQDPRAIGAVRKDGSCWVVDAAAGQAVHLSPTGGELASVGGFSNPTGVCVDPSDYSVWVADTGNNQVVHLDATGAVLSQSGGFAAPSAVSVAAGGCWVADTGNNQLVQLGSQGQELQRVSGFSGPKGVTVGEYFPWVADTGNHRVAEVRGAAYIDPLIWTDSSFTSPSVIGCGPIECTGLWVMDDAGQIVALNSDSGTESWRGPVSHPTAMAVNADFISNSAYPDGSVWVGSGDQNRVYHYAAEGSVRWRSAAPLGGGPISVYGKDGSCWVSVDPHLVRVARDGAELAEASVPLPRCIVTDQANGSAWVTSEDPVSGLRAIIHVASAGQILTSWGSYSLLYGFDFNPHDNTFWLGCNAPSVEVIHAAADGTQLSVASGFSWVLCVAANPTDDSCWVADVTANAVVHLGPDGKQITRLTGFDSPQEVVVDPADGSIWVAEVDVFKNPWTAKVSHLASDGTVIWSSAAFVNPVTIALNQQDHSVWVSDSDGRSVIHLAPDGAELWRGQDCTAPLYVSVDPIDASVWVSDAGAGELTHLVIGLHADFTASPTSGPAPLTVQFTDQSPGTPTSWSWDFGDGSTSTDQNPSHQYTKSGIYTVTLTVGDGTHTETTTKTDCLQVTPVDVTASFWAEPQIAACVDAGIVAGYPDGTYQPSLPVTRDQMAVYISRALAGGDAEVPTGPAVADFPDVPIDYWAYRYIEYCYAQQIVAGYSDGYRPQEPVTRDQMAVYVARSIVSPTGDAGLANYTPPATPDFPDVPTTFWAYKYIEYCKSHVIVQGFPDGTYHPEYVVSRDQMAVYIQRAFQLPL